MREPRNILIVGVGGQGTILAGKVLSRVALLSGYDVKFSEIHGMAQRGGSVVTQVRIGEKVFSPVVDAGTADFVLAFEQLEALRWAHMLRPGGVMIASTQVIEPMPVLTGVAKYPAGIMETLQGGGRLLAVDALGMATAAGTAKASNVVLLGCLARLSGTPRELWEQSLRETVPARFLEVNLTAFAGGWDAAAETAEAVR